MRTDPLSFLGNELESLKQQGLYRKLRILEGKPYEKHVGPALYVIDSSNVNNFDKASSLAPDDFKPTFGVE